MWGENRIKSKEGSRGRNLGNDTRGNSKSKGEKLTGKEGVTSKQAHSLIPPLG